MVFCYTILIFFAFRAVADEDVKNISFDNA